MAQYHFTNSWFHKSGKKHFDLLFGNAIKPCNLLEVGCYEGQATCYFIEKLSSFHENPEIHCIDTWEGGQEHQENGCNEINMQDVESTFFENIKYALELTNQRPKITIHKQHSFDALTRLYQYGKKEFFDLIYIDASHEAIDVLEDAILSFRLLRKGGVIVFDDYLWGTWGDRKNSQNNIYRCPKMAIDNFVNIYFEKMMVEPRLGVNQLAIVKIST